MAGEPLAPRFPWSEGERMKDYLHTLERVYAEAARQPDRGLCCAGSPLWRFPDLRVPAAMQEMNYGCGSTVDPRDLDADDTILYVGVGGGLEALQFAYFTRRPGSVLAVDPVREMRVRAQANFAEAARLNPWFDPAFITLLDGSALALPVPAAHVSLVAQNCLFNVFTRAHLERALAEVVRVLRPGGKFCTSDPVTPVPLPADLADDARLRARCLSGCQTLPDYLAALTGAGLNRVEVRARVPYRYLDPLDYPALTAPVMLESVEVAASKVPASEDGPEVFTGRTATYAGPDETFAASREFVLRRGIPVSVSDAAAERLRGHGDVVLTGPTYHVRGGGCC
jgi:SAM-dependent methyltransferase